MSECTVLSLKDAITGENVTLLDVRESGEFAGGRVSGAKLLPLGEIGKRHKEIDHSHTVYVMCRSGRRSAEAQNRLKSLGFQNVINVKGGFEAWKAEQLPIEKDENAPWALERQVRFAAGLLVLLGVVLSLVIHPYFIGISAFVGAGLTFAGATDWCGMGLLLAKMPWNQRQSS